MGEEISVNEIIRVVKKYLFTIMILSLTGAILSVLAMMVFIKPNYESSAQLLVNQENRQEQAIQYNEIQSNIQLINTYRDIITGQEVLNQVSQKLENRYSIDELREAVKVSQTEDSQSFYITATMPSAKDAQKVVESITSVFETILKEVYGKEGATIYLLSPASYNPNKISPSLIKYLIVGLVLGLLVSFIIMLISELLDTTIKDETYLTQLGLINLGGIYELSAKDLKQTRLSGRRSSAKTRKKV